MAIHVPSSSLGLLFLALAGAYVLCAALESAVTLVEKPNERR